MQRVLQRLSFRSVCVPSGEHVLLPEDIRLEFPQESSVALGRRHLLGYIPWNQSHMQYVPAPYHDFFGYVLPYLSARTTDVHTALSVSYVSELVAHTPGVVDEHLVHIAVILHDSGWGQMHESEIADSLDYSGLYSDKARAPKEKHATLGADMALRLMKGHSLTKHLPKEQKQLISDIVYYHDQMRLWPRSKGPEPIECKLTIEADKLWSYTHENFWQDTVRKHVDPVTYWNNLRDLLDSYFVLPQSKDIARRLLEDRYAELEVYKDVLGSLIALESNTLRISRALATKNH